LCVVDRGLIIHPDERKIGHLTNSEIARLADAAAGSFCYTMDEGRPFPGPTGWRANVILCLVELKERIGRESR
jgi:hypothetical protein